MAVELILLEDVDGLGNLGDQVRVAEGHARNYLLPKHKACVVTPANLRRLEARKIQLQQEHEERITVAQAVAEKIGRLSITVPVEAAENDKLYGSVGPVQVVEALAAEGIQLDREEVLLEEPIRELGVYTVDIHLHTEVQAALKVWVVRK
ncbi:MAG: 50S ribosomal protein L9 [Lentisphaerae bacterium]|jgi:large subunit ribosomal protein L9|nr:50S ribosomal protein L9 [Lentisphaerota bacterium]MBT4816441.1 50S ribosomal protein L9 [Lentisphaerota bacterium]MBT5606774.1 50S ribosomal protein L9 [Lentisphaerota bacterium]MBT7061570.1 50S ribosomal protein L9 [Lentisphaerota bacterium]MBT7843879.1 50S ribosomal protein L9 [Lentisphaerota bacterium]